MSRIPLPPLPSETIFRRIGDKFKSISDDFYNLYIVLKDVWLIGTYLRWPFWWLYLYFLGVYNLCYQADDIFREVKRWVDGLIEGSAFEDMLYWLSIQYRAIRTDSVSWVKGRIAAVSYDMWRFVNTPTVWVFDKIDQWISWFGAFRTDPIGTIRNFLISGHPFLSSFLFYPAQYIINRIYEGIAFLRDLRDNPPNTIVKWIALWYGWIWQFLNNPRDFIVEKVKAFSAEIRLFFDNPVFWVRGKIKQVFGWTDTDISDIPYYVFKRVLMNAMSYVTREEGLVRQVLCDTIMRFM